MADINFTSTLGLTEKFIDQGDGTHARQVSVVGIRVNATGTDRSIVATTTSQQLMAANTLRRKLIVKNDTGIVVWINFGAAAVAVAGAGNYAIAANGGYFEIDGALAAVNIIAASGTPAISAREF